jgi:hypothetical protein
MLGNLGTTFMRHEIEALDSSAEQCFIHSKSRAYESEYGFGTPNRFWNHHSSENYFL